MDDTPRDINVSIKDSFGSQKRYTFSHYGVMNPACPECAEREGIWRRTQPEVQDGLERCFCLKCRTAFITRWGPVEASSDLDILKQLFQGEARK